MREVAGVKMQINITSARSQSSECAAASRTMRRADCVCISLTGTSTLVFFLSRHLICDQQIEKYIPVKIALTGCFLRIEVVIFP